MPRNPGGDDIIWQIGQRVLVPPFTDSVISGNPLAVIKAGCAGQAEVNIFDFDADPRARGPQNVLERRSRRFELLPVSAAPSLHHPRNTFAGPVEHRQRPLFAPDRHAANFLHVQRRADDKHIDTVCPKRCVKRSEAMIFVPFEERIKLVADW